MASNTNIIQDEAGEYDDWIELYNDSDVVVDIGHWFLSDDPAARFKWQFPQNTLIQPYSYLLIWCDDHIEQGFLHTNFRLSKDGEWVGLVRPDFTFEDSLGFGEQISNYSYGRIPDGGQTLIQINVPTPGAANPQDVIGIAEPPRFSLPSGVFSNTQKVTLNSDYPDALILYSVDGSIPDVWFVGSTTFEYSTPILIESTTVLRARVYPKNYLPSDVTTSIYIIGENHHLPILSFVTQPDNLFSDDNGIYENWDESGREWERDVVVSYFDDEELEFSIPAGIRIQGNSSRKRAKKSFRLFFRDSYGAEKLDYKMFDINPVEHFENLVARAGYDDDIQMDTGTLLRDPFGSELYRRLGQKSSSSTLCVLYLNDDFWGIYDIRESVNEFFIHDHFGYDEFDIIRLRNRSWELDYGDANEWRDFLDFIEYNNFESDGMYNQLAARMDVKNYTDLQIHTHATQYRSWTYGSFLFREKSPNAQWKIVPWDLDRALTQLNWNGFAYYDDNRNEYWINIITKRLMENAGYRHYFVNRFCDLYNTILRPENSVPILDSLAAYIEPEIPREFARWDSSTTKWYNNIDSMRDFMNERWRVTHDQLQEYFGFGEPVVIQLLEDSGNGYIKLSTIHVDEFPWTGSYYPENKISVTAVANPGFQCVGWTDTSLPQTATIEIYPDDGLVLQPVFEPLDNYLVINEFKYAHTDDRDCSDWIELYNPMEQTVSLSGWTLTDDNNEHQFFFHDATQIPSGDYLVVCQDVRKFRACYADVEPIVGNTNFGWDENDQIRLFNQDGALVDEVAYSDQPPWDAVPARGMASLALIDPKSNNALASNWQAEGNYGSPGRENFATSAVQGAQPSKLPARMMLFDNYPNPFNSYTVFRFVLSNNAVVQFDVHDINGRLVFTENEFYNSGEHSKQIDLSHVSSGLYILTVSDGQCVERQKLMMIK